MGRSAAQLGAKALELVQIPSVIAHEKALADFVEAWATKHFGKACVTRHSHSLVVGDLTDSRPALALVGHLDTVPLHPESKPARIEGDRLFGLGSSDMKGALAVMMALAEDLPRTSLPWNVLYVFYEREEGSFDESGLQPLLDTLEPLRKLAFAIAMEPTDGAVQVACLGTLHATLHFEGKAAHSARPWQGKNAIHAAGEILSQLNALPRREVTLDGFTFYEVMNATLASGGRARNIIPEAFELNVNYRFAPGKSVERAKQDVMDFVAGRARVEFPDSSPSGRVCAGNPHFQRLLQCSGAKAESKQAWTDVARFALVGVDAVNYGPGETAQAHQKDESAPIGALADCYGVLEKFLTGAPAETEKPARPKAP